jgi:hypothetical protein
VREREERHACRGCGDERVEAQAEDEASAGEARGRGGEVRRRLEHRRAEPAAQRRREPGVAVGLPRLQRDRNAGITERREGRPDSLGEIPPAGEMAERDEDRAGGGR